VVRVTPPEPPPPTRPPTASLVLAARALHSSQVVILDALEQPTGLAIEAELWHTMLTLVRSQERMLSEVLLGTPLPRAGEAES
jgi:hypothetical protein